MELLLILTYVALCYAIFKIFRVPVNQWSLATATLGGIIGIAAEVAIYTEYWHHVALIRRILLRMRSWQNYIFMEGH
jgi:uncharacterized membrane protein